MNDIKYLISLFPPHIAQEIYDADELVEIIIDLGRPMELRFFNDEFYVNESIIITEKDLEDITSNFGKFGEDNRTGVNGCLHRISRIVNRFSETIGLTIRIGRPFLGTVNKVKDIIDSNNNILLLGKPGSGKTSLLRDVARYLSVDQRKRVVIVDTSNEIAGDGNVPHPAIGRARRLQVPFGKTQYEVMIEAIDNHYPEVLMIDEISTSIEADAARTAAQRGIQLIGTAHGCKIEDLINNPPLASLIGGITSVTLSDDTVKARGLEKKSILERKHEPTFNVVVELDSFESLAIHHNVRDTVDAYLKEAVYWPEQRVIVGDEVKITKPGKIIHKDQVYAHEEFSPKRKR